MPSEIIRESSYIISCAVVFGCAPEQKDGRFGFQDPSGQRYEMAPSVNLRFCPHLVHSSMPVGPTGPLGYL